MINNTFLYIKFSIKKYTHIKVFKKIFLKIKLIKYNKSSKFYKKGFLKEYF